jgi:hypothetical protein
MVQRSGHLLGAPLPVQEAVDPSKVRTCNVQVAAGSWIPELYRVIAFYGGNFSDRVTVVPLWIDVQQYILPTINNTHRLCTLSRWNE